MKPYLFVLIFGGCTCFLAAARSTGYAYSSRFDANMVQPEVYDTSVSYSQVISHPNSASPLTGILPEPGAKLNYTQIMFDHPQIIGADQYLVEVALDDGSNLFKRVLVKQKDSSTATMLSNFEFGKKYVWRYTGLHAGKELGWNGSYSFEILSTPLVDKNLFRINVIQNDSVLNSGGLITLDLFGTIIDRKGNFVWYFPYPNGAEEKDSLESFLRQGTRDIQLSSLGTVTAIYVTAAQERNLRGDILWHAPARSAFNPEFILSGKPYFYHHCFKRLMSGNYMVLDIYRVAKKLNNTLNSSLPISSVDSTKTLLDYEIIREIGPHGDLVWSWSSENYFTESELESLVQNNAGKGLRNPQPGGHMNAFDVDEEKGLVYVGFRNANRVIKIDKKSGQVLCAWGDSVTNKGAKNGEGFFSRQHGTTLLRDGSIAVFSNNTDRVNVDGENLPSSVVVFTQPTDSTNSRIKWKFDCRFDSLDKGTNKAGGNVDEMKSGNLLVCMGDINRVFEITLNKHIVWNAIIEKYDEYGLTWRPLPGYRAHYTSSLYPCYFTIQTSRDTLGKTQPSFHLRVFNDGTEGDSYEVDIQSLSGKYKEHFSTTVLPGKKSMSFNIEPGNLSVANDKIVVSVKSKTNPDFVRTVYIPFK